MKEKMLFYDKKFKKSFYATLEDVNKAVEKFNEELLNSGYGSVNEFYTHIPETGNVEDGDILGWNIMRDGLLSIDCDMSEENDNSCMALSYNVEPKEDYYKMSTFA